MKLKSRPEDFVVEELTQFQCTGGPFAFYRLRKRGLGTPEAAQAVIQAWNLPRDAIRHGGLKDRHAETTQYITIFRGQPKNLEDRSFLLEYLGQAGRHYASKDIEANRFSITLRRLSESSVAEIQPRLKALQVGGLVNYFDDQRFGSLGFSKEFIGRAWCLGDYERALYLSIAEANVHDRPREKEQKEILRDFWGQWPLCKDRLDRSHRRSIVTYLVDHPTDFKRALALLRPDLRSIYVSAFQSYLWNRWLSAIIESKLDASHRALMESVCGPLFIPSSPSPLVEKREPGERLMNSEPLALATGEQQDTVLSPTPEASAVGSQSPAASSGRPGSEGLPEAETIKPSLDLSWLKHLQLPLPSARQHDWPDEYFPLLEKILADLQMDIHQVRLKFPRDTFFSRGLRDAWLIIRNLDFEFVPDDESPDRKLLQLEFELPRGSYATMLVKHLKIETPESESPDE